MSSSSASTSQMPWRSRKWSSATTTRIAISVSLAPGAAVASAREGDGARDDRAPPGSRDDVEDPLDRGDRVGHPREPLAGGDVRRVEADAVVAHLEADRLRVLARPDADRRPVARVPGGVLHRLGAAEVG